MTKITYAQQAAAAARKGDHGNAAALYRRAEMEADLRGESAKGKRHGANAAHYERIFENRQKRATEALIRVMEVINAAEARAIEKFRAGNAESL